MFAKSLTLAKSDIDRAFAQNEFAILLQPQIEVAGGAVVAAEAFVRWNHPAFGTMTPQLFLPFVEAHGESPRLLEAVVRRALDAAATFQAAGRDWRVSVNLGVSDLKSGIAPEIVQAALEACGADPTLLVLEAPEAALAEDDSIVRAALERLRLFGCGVALDSGGALPLDSSETAPELFTEIKIGGPSIMRFAEIARKVDGGRIARRLAFARKHGLRSVAVGVEQEKTLSALVKLGFGAIQGAFVAKPATLEALMAWDGAWSGESQIVAPAAMPARPRPRLVVPTAPVAPPVATQADCHPGRSDAESRDPGAADTELRGPWVPGLDGFATSPGMTPPSNTKTTAAAKLVDQLSSMPAGFSFAEDEDGDAFDVGFDDDAFEDAPAEARYQPMEEAEADPSEDPELDGEELGALDASPPLHAGLIERPRKKAMHAMRMEANDEAPDPAPLPEPEDAPVADFTRRLALRIKTDPVKPSLMQRLGLGRFGRR